MGERRGEIENGNGNQNLGVKKPRMKWTADLHQSFLDAIATLGGEHCKPNFFSFSIQI